MAGAALNPEIWRLLDYCNMDRVFQHGAGAWLQDDKGRRFLDCYSQYGAVVLGHNAPPVVAAMRAALDEGQPAMVQPYRAPNAVALADRLVALAPAGLARCVFTTSGAETVEAAIKLARISRGRDLIVSCEGSYHGKTMGARAASGRLLDDRLFGPRPPGFARVPFGDADGLARFLEERGGEVAAVIVEPIQGERGVHLPPPGYLRAVRDLCSRHGVVLIFDEIQTGLGRTGRLFACDHDGVAPDILLLAKGLGGGLVPLGACLASEAVWHPHFALSHSSTFANNNISCRVGLAVLEALTRGGACDRAARAGDRLLAGLRDLAARYPAVVAEVRGRGLLAAVELRPATSDDGFLRSYLQNNGVYGYAAAAALAERYGVLVLPALNGSNVLRVAPSLLIEDAELDLALGAFDALFADLEEDATNVFARTFWCAARPDAGTRPANAAADLHLPRPAVQRRPDMPTYAFLIHPTRREDLVTMDPSLGRLPAEAFDQVVAGLADSPAGAVFQVPPLVSATGARARGWLIGLGMLPEEMMRRGRRAVGAQLAQAAAIAADLGAQVLGLGAYTSIFSRRGLDLVGACPVVTTGNCLTAQMAFAAVESIMARRGMDMRTATVGVVGARGSVGSLCTLLLAQARPARLILVGNPTGGADQMRQLAARARALGVAAVVETNDLRQLSACDVVLSATSSRATVLDDATLAPGTIVCDVARPPDASAALRARPDITVIDGGLVQLPDPTADFGVGNVQGLPQGQQLACLSETILLALAGETRNTGIGDDVGLEEVNRVAALARLHGFRLAEPPLDALDRRPVPALHATHS